MLAIMHIFSFDNEEVNCEAHTIAAQKGFKSKATMRKFQETINEAIEIGHDATVVAHGHNELEDNGAEVIDIKTFLVEHPDLKRIEHKSNCIELTTAFDDTATVFLIFGNKTINLDKVNLEPDEPEAVPDLPSPASSTSTDVGDFENISGQGMTQATDFFFDDNFC